MQFKTLASLLAITSVAIAQDLSQVPKCAEAPALAVFGKTGCQLTDIKCICSASNLVSDLETAVAKACSAQDLATANAFAVSTCQKAGVTLTIPGYTASGSGTASASGSSSTGSVASASASSSMSSMSSASAAASSSAASSASSSMSVTSSASSTSASTSATPGAANTVQVGGSIIFGAIMAVLAL